MLEWSFFHTFTQRHLRHLSTASFDDASLLGTMPDIDQAPLQFINVMNLLDPLLHSSIYFGVKIYEVKVNSAYQLRH